MSCQSLKRQRVDSGDENESPKRKQLKNDNDETFFKLGPKRRVTVREFRSKTLIDIREYYMADDGAMRPGKKGISLTYDQWQDFKSYIDSIDVAVEKLGNH
eukprot:73579_1